VLLKFAIRPWLLRASSVAHRQCSFQGRSGYFLKALSPQARRSLRTPNVSAGGAGGDTIFVMAAGSQAGLVDEVVLDSGNAFNGAHSCDQAAICLVALHLRRVSRCVSHGDHDRARIEKEVAPDDMSHHFLFGLPVRAGEGVQKVALADDANHPANRAHGREQVTR